MEKLYPPIIEGKLPAQAGKIIQIPFSLNRTVSINSIFKMGLIIKTVSTGKLIVSNFLGDFQKNSETNTYYAQFDISELIANNKILPGQFYKIQICFVSKNSNNNYKTFGYYSSFGVMKYTTLPEVSIPDFEINHFKERNIIGVYKNKDYTEKVYTYEFILRDAQGNIIETSGEQFHDSSTDIIRGESTDSWIIRKDLSENETYYLSYKITTNNNLKAYSNSYKIVQVESVSSDFQCKLFAELQPEEAYVKLYLISTENQIISGNYILSRTSSKTNFSTWEEIYRFSLNSYDFTEKDEIILWEDYTCESEQEYIYSLQAYNDYGLYSERIFSNLKEVIIEDNATFQVEPVKSSFEDIYLFDGEQQLTIKFNPKINSFKTNILETKTNTLGSKYPFIFRNGIVNYKEFQISGLISILMDPNEKFLSRVELNENSLVREKTPEEYRIFSEFCTNLNFSNIYKEKNFREEVFNWLTNGQPKLFRSSTEGNFLVQLMNVSMTPVDTLGRMLYNFSCTAYEIDEANFKTLNKYNFNRNFFSQIDNYHLSVNQVSLKQYNSINLPQEAFNIKITNALEGALLRLYFSNGDSTLIEIGKKGAYALELKDKKLIKVSFQNYLCEKTDIKLTYCYYSDVISNFNNIINIIIKDKVSQCIGKTIIENPNNNNNNNDNFLKLNQEILKIYSLEAYSRPIITIYEKEEKKYYLDREKISEEYFYYNPVNIDSYFSKDVICKIIDNSDNNKYIDLFSGKEVDITKEDFFKFKIKENGIDESSEISLEGIQYNNQVIVENPSIVINTPVYTTEQTDEEIPNDELLLKSTQQKIILKNLNNIEYIEIGQGVFLNFCYQLKTIIKEDETV